VKGPLALPRKLFLLALVLVPIAAGSVFWGPPLLRRLPWAHVRRVEVVGTVYVAPDVVLDAAGIRTEASVFDDFSVAEARVAEHPLITGARIRPRGLQTVRIEVQELVPLALAATPELKPVLGDGTILPIDPSRTRVDLPVLTAPVNVSQGRLVGGEGVRALRSFARVQEHDPGLAAIVAEVRTAPGGGIALALVGSQDAGEIWLPADPDEAVLRRVRATLADLNRRRWSARRVEARYGGQVVVQLNRSPLKAS
jgi:hypothetical protein